MNAPMKPRRALPTPETALAGLWARIPRHIRLTFAASMVLGLVTHLYMFTNKLPNHDDIGHLFSADYGTASGRWLLPFVLGLDGDFSMPWLIGVLSLLGIGATACLTVALLRIRRPAGCIITAALLVAFPSVASTFTYMFTADAYFLSLALAAFGAYAAVRWRLGLPLGALAIALSMGIYQSYFGVAAVLMVGALLFETLDGDRPLPALLLRGVKLVATLAVGLGGYLVMVRLTTRSVGLVDYMGISDMGKLSLSELPGLILKSYGSYYHFFLQDEFSFHFDFLKYALALAAVATVVLGAMVLARRRLGAARTALALVLAVLYPLAGNLIFVMVPGGNVHLLMLYGMCFLLLAPVALGDYAGLVLETAPVRGRTAAAAASWVILCSLALTAYSYMIVDNRAYLKIDLSYQQCASYSTRLLGAIEGTQGYRQGMPVVLVGSDQREPALSPTPPLDQVGIIGVFGLADFRTTYTYGHFLRYYMGFPDPVYLGDSEQALILAETEAVAAMPLYPEAGAIQVLEDTVVVRLN